MHPYLPHTIEDIKTMLNKIGISHIDELFADIPSELLLKNDLNLEASKSEMTVREELEALADMNKVTIQGKNFLGAGAYEHYIPSVIKHISSRQEFLTAYTPYQPEISQGTLQMIYEFQSMICSLTDMQASNASLYDGGTAMAEAVFMAFGKNKKKNVLISELVNPEYIKVVKTYASHRGLKVIIIPSRNGQVDLEVLKNYMDEETSSVIIQSPNFYGLVEDGIKIKENMDALGTKALLIVSVNPTSLGLLKAPGTYGADIVVGEGQPLGNSMQFGGPYVGFIATNQKLMRQLPGRIVGETVDKDGKRAYVLTLQAREQHIRREKATSNITSNQGLNALIATIYMALLGKNGIFDVAKSCFDNAHYVASKLSEYDEIILPYGENFFHEFVIEVKKADQLHLKLIQQGYMPGLLVDDSHILLCVTETKTKKQLDQFIEEVLKTIQQLEVM